MSKYFCILFLLHTQAINNYEKEQGKIKSSRGPCGVSKSQNSTPIPSPAPTPPPLSMNSLLQKSLQSPFSYQVKLLTVVFYR